MRTEKERTAEAAAQLERHQRAAEAALYELPPGPDAAQALLVPDKPGTVKNPKVERLGAE